MKLLLLPCSRTKILTQYPVKAVNLYDGPMYRTLRKAIREGVFPKDCHVFILSAKYGIISSDKKIPHYDLIDDDRRNS